MAQRPLGKDLHWWLKHTGLDIAPIRRLLEKAPVSVLDDGRYRTALREEAVDAVVLATGYRPAFPYLTGSGALSANGRPLHRGGIATAVPDLGFVGMEFQRSFSSKTLRGIGRDAGHVLSRLRRQAA
jgi:putative flavoprotein involved in K+ transport